MADVALVLEGSYPYVTGGVAEWTDRLLRGLPELRFAVVHLRDGDAPAGPSRYQRPRNLEELVEIELDPDRDDPSAALARVPPAGIYHALCTGTAGIVAACAAAAHARPLLVTEHGLAWREARLGIAACKPPKIGRATSPGGRRREAARLRGRAASIERQALEAYRAAHTVTSVCSANARLQRALGADPARLRVIPNAAPAPSAAPRHDGPPCIGLVGRVVPVKDVATFVRACRLLADAIPGSTFAVVGPLDHDPAYADACQRLAARLGLAERLAFVGAADPAAWYARLDAVVLTSRSEAQPLVALEAMAAGVPVVATAVGGCPELLSGTGLLTPAGDAAATARAVTAVLCEPRLRARLVRGARARVGERHDQQRILDGYRRLYAAAS